MASLSKNGSELYRLDLLRESRSYRTNGVVLINKGFGWKRGKNYGPEKIHEIISLRKEREEKTRREFPCFCAYRKAVQDEFPLSTRWQYLLAIEVLGDDLDGIWSELNDRGVCVSIEDIVHIEHLRGVSLIEMRNAEQAEIAAQIAKENPPVPDCPQGADYSIHLANCNAD